MGGKIFKTGLVYLLLSVVVMLLDYLTKQWIVSNVPVNDISGSIEGRTKNISRLLKMLLRMLRRQCLKAIGLGPLLCGLNWKYSLLILWN